MRLMPSGGLIVCCAENYSGASTPPAEQAEDATPDFISRPSHDLDEEDLDEDQSKAHAVEPRKGGYDSRIEQILYEHPDLDIQIVQAGKESGGGYITYTIRTGV